MEIATSPTNCEIVPDSWLGERLGKPAFRLRASSHFDLDWWRSQVAGPAFYDVRVPCDWIDLVRSLCQAGFVVVDAPILLESGNPPSHTRTNLTITLVEPSDRISIVELASEAFRYSRFHLDPSIPNATASQIKADWAANCCDGRRGDRVWVARQNSRVVGFLASLVSNDLEDTIATIDLVAVDPSCQGQGIGRALVTTFMDHYHNRCNVFQVGTQAANLPALRLYQSLGFKIARTQYLLHYHATS